MSLVQRFFSFEKFSLFLGKIWKSWIFFFFLIYIHKQSSLNSTWNSWIQKNIETWNKLTNFKLNHDVANQMWSEAKLGHLLLLDPFRMLETWHAWTLIMIKWFRLALGRLEPWLWSFGICLKWLGAYTRKAWTLIMIFWYLLEMAWAYTWKACILWVFDLWSCSCLHAPLMGSSVALRPIQETILGFHTK